MVVSLHVISCRGVAQLTFPPELMFTKLNVVDKFGQAISAINPAPVNYGAAVPTISPCLSDTYFPGTIGDVDPSTSTARANCVLPQRDNLSCPFVNLPPAINQPARFNAEFVTKSNGSWAICSEWEVRYRAKPSIPFILNFDRIQSGAGLL